jgi:PIN domain nuclease of toxin-antitoxin system
MEILLDTHTLIWFLKGDENLSVKARKAIEDTANFKYISIATFWELAIKTTLGKFNFTGGFKKFVELTENYGFVILPITIEHTFIVSSLEFVHRDPFDRILVAQGKAENLTMITRDENIKKYNVATLW